MRNRYGSLEQPRPKQNNRAEKKRNPTATGWARACAKSNKFVDASRREIDQQLYKPVAGRLLAASKVRAR